MTEVVPALREVIEAQQAEFDDVASCNVNARRFHETLVARCGNETMIVVLGSLETIWSAHESSGASQVGEIDLSPARQATR